MSEAQLYIQIAVWSQVASSIVFIAVLVYMWFRLIMPVLMAAQERSNRQIAEAERHRDEVKGALDRTARGDSQRGPRCRADRAARRAARGARARAVLAQAARRESARCEMRRASSSARARRPASVCATISSSARCRSPATMPRGGSDPRSTSV